MTNKIIIIIILLAVVIIAGMFFTSQKQPDMLPENEAKIPEEPVAKQPVNEQETEPTTEPQDEKMATEPKEEPKTITLEEIKNHNNKDDCWFAITGKVYDVTNYIADGIHPGGAALLQGCGKDATELFETRPMGSGTPHSERAISFLPNFYIGDLK